MSTVRDISGNSTYVDTTNVSSAPIDPNTILLTTISSQLAGELLIHNMDKVLNSVEDVSNNTRIANRHLKEITDEEFENDNHK